jgi:signal transduction histidine kinase
VAHELRTPLATQRAILELALADLAADTATWREAGEGALRTCEQQEHLLDACLALARSRTKLQRRETIDLGQIVSKVVQDHDLHKLTTKLQLEHAFTSGDPDLIERLIANLVTNAIRHNHAGGCVHVATSSTDNQALFIIENTGTPIPPAELTRFFEPFQQLGPRTIASGGGLGLGLVVAKAVADTHDAVISATARSAGGLRVEVAFSASPRAG